MTYDQVASWAKKILLRILRATNHDQNEETKDVFQGENDIWHELKINIPKADTFDLDKDELVDLFNLIAQNINEKMKTLTEDKAKAAEELFRK